MDFNDTPEEAEFRVEARAFLEKHLTRKEQGADMRQRQSSEDFLKSAKAWQDTKAKGGFAQITWPKEWGGRGGTMMEQVIWGQEEGQFNAPVQPFAIGLGMCIPTVIAFGSDAHKARYVNKALHGDEIWCQLFSEPSAGSDVAGLKTRAVKDGDEWVINGQKVWTSGAHYCDYGILLVRTDPKVAKHKGLTMFIVDMKQPGVDVRPIHQMSGGSEFNEVYFTDVRIKDADRLGDVGHGWKVALVTLMNERLAVGGSSGPEYGEFLQLARELGVLDDASMRERIADWYVSSEGYNLSKFRTMTALSRGQTPGPENSIGKILNANRMQAIGNDAIEAMGHYGIMLEDDLLPFEGAFQRAFMWSPGLRIAGGTDEILKNIIAERVLGLPQDVRVDKDIAFEDMKAG